MHRFLPARLYQLTYLEDVEEDGQEAKEVESIVAELKDPDSKLSELGVTHAVLHRYYKKQIQNIHKKQLSYDFSSPELVEFTTLAREYFKSHWRHSSIGNYSLLLTKGRKQGGSAWVFVWKRDFGKKRFATVFAKF